MKLRNGGGRFGSFVTLVAIIVKIIQKFDKNMLWSNFFKVFEKNQEN